MHQVVYSLHAEAQLNHLFAQIASAASPEIAAPYVDAILNQCDSLATFPERGTLRDELWPGLRVLGFRRRVAVACVVEEDAATVHGIFYGGQNLEVAFEE